MQTTIRRACAGAVLTGAVAGAVLAGSTTSAGAAPADAHHVKRTVTQCSHGKFATYFSLPRQGGFSSHVIDPGQCVSLPAKYPGHARVKEILPSGKSRVLRSVAIGERVYVVVDGTAAHPTVKAYHFS